MPCVRGTTAQQEYSAPRAVDRIFVHAHARSPAGPMNDFLRSKKSLLPRCVDERDEKERRVRAIGRRGFRVAWRHILCECERV